MLQGVSEKEKQRLMVMLEEMSSNAGHVGRAGDGGAGGSGSRGARGTGAPR